MEKKEWFEEWFDSPYYDMLYQHRDENEAANFIYNLVKRLNIKPNHKILDLACGKGRHSINLNKLGFDVIGVDLSKRKIGYAKQFENKRLKFQLGDMREVVHENHFTHVFNLFTSFGYFSNPLDNQKVIQSVYKSLQPNGIFVLDFLNATKIKVDSFSEKNLEINNVNFKVSKSIQGHEIVKKIKVLDKQNQFQFEERVTAFNYRELIDLISTSNFNIIYSFGDYYLNPFNEDTSERVIIVANKKGE